MFIVHEQSKKWRKSIDLKECYGNSVRCVISYHWYANYLNLIRADAIFDTVFYFYENQESGIVRDWRMSRGRVL